MIREDETLEDLQCGGLELIQKKKGFRFGVDAVLLANFATIPKGGKVIDLGTGSGVIPLLLTVKSKASKIHGVEIQKHLVEMAQRTIIHNHLEHIIEIIQGNIRYLEGFGNGSYDAVVTNPPYTKKNAGIRCMDSSKDISRYEVHCSLEDVIRTAARLLRPGGQFSMVHKPERLADILCTMRSFKIEPKVLRFVHPYPSKKPNILLIKGTRGGGEDLKIMPPLYVHHEAGGYTEEIYSIYGKKGECSHEG